jgi:hypothetical protein
MPKTCSNDGLKQAGLPAHYSPHSLRETGITTFLENDGTLQAAQRIAGHADSRTTELYDRRRQKVLLEDMKRVRYEATMAIDCATLNAILNDPEPRHAAPTGFICCAQ